MPISHVHAADLKYTHAIRFPIQVVRQRAHQAAEQRTAHHRHLAGDRIEHRNRFNAAREVALRWGIDKRITDQLRVPSQRQRTAHIVRSAPLLRLGAHRRRGPRRRRGNVLVAGQARHFADQVLFDLEIESEARRRDDERVSVLEKFKSDTAECIRDRLRIDWHAEHSPAAIDSHRSGLALRHGERLIVDRARLAAADVDDQARDVFDVLDVARIVDTALEPVCSIG